MEGRNGQFQQKKNNNNNNQNQDIVSLTTGKILFISHQLHIYTNLFWAAHLTVSYFTVW